MATTTPNLGLTKPVVGASADTWGSEINASLDTLDAKVLDKTTGGTVTGNLSVTGTVNTPNVNAATSLALQTGGSTKATLDSAGNLGLGVTPSAWGSAYKAFQTVGAGTFFSSGATGAAVSTNVFNDGTNNRYIANGAAYLYTNGDTHRWFTAPSGNAGATIAFGDPKVSITQGGNLLVGTTTDSGYRVLTRQLAADNLGIGNFASDGSSIIRMLHNGTVGAIDVSFVGGGAYTPLAFRTSDIERARITSGGNLLVGTTVDTSERINAVGNGTGTGFQTNPAIFAARQTVAGREVPFAYGTDGTNSALISMLSGNMGLFTNSVERARITSAGNLRPGADNAYSLGEPSFRWSVVYAATGTINTSDVRAKLDFAPTFGLDFINALEPVSYRYKNGKTVIDQVEDGVEEVPAVLDEQGNEVTPATTKPKFKSVERVVEGIRRHHGLKAQQVKSVLDTLGVDFAGWVMDDPNDPDSPQGLRYDQFIAPLIRAVQELSEQNAALESRLAALEAK